MFEITRVIGCLALCARYAASVAGQTKTTVNRPWQTRVASISWLVIGSVIGLCLGESAQAAEAELKTMVITATRTAKSIEEAPVRTEVVDRREIERTGARTLREALENVPGLLLSEVHGKSGYQVSMQGLKSDQVLVLIDGLPISASTGSTVDLSQYLLDNVARIEIVKGAASAQYGSAAMGGVINVITKTIGPGLSVKGAFDAGSWGEQNASGGEYALAKKHLRLSVEGGSETWRWRVGGDVLRDDGHALDPQGWRLQGDQIARTQVEGRIAWHGGVGRSAYVELNRYSEDDETRYERYFPPNLVPHSKLESIERNRHVANLSWRFDNGVSTQIKGVDESYDAKSITSSNGTPIIDRPAAINNRHLTGQVDLPPWRDQSWQFGFDLHQENLSQSNNGVSELTGTTLAERTNNELFMQNDLYIGDIWELVFGVRWQRDSDFGNHTAPKISLRSDWLDSAKYQGVFRASIGQGYRVPNLKERHYIFDHSALGYMVLGNPDLRPEESDSFQLGTTFDFKKNGLKFDVNAFHNRIDNLIQVDSNDAQTVNGVRVFRYGNIARARTSGFELGVKWQPLESLALNATWSRTDTKDLDTRLELTRRPRDSYRVGVDWEMTSRSSLSLRAQYQSSELVSSETLARSPAWHNVDITLNHKIRRGVTGFVSIKNVANRQRDFSNADDFSPKSPRFTFFGVRFHTGAK